MASRWDLEIAVRERVAREVGPGFQQGARRAALLYPSPYRVGMSSLGYQWVLRLLRDAGLAVERVFLPDDPQAYKALRASPVSCETGTPLSRFPLIGVSLAYELELAGLITALELAGIPPLRKDRGPGDPVIVLGGPLTFSNPLPAAPFVDAMLIGEADDTVVPAFEAFWDCKDREAWFDVIQGLDGGFVPERMGCVLPVNSKAKDAHLPAHSLIRTAETELSNMFLVEGERGCHRTCTFCVMRRSTNGGMRLVTPDRVIGLVPEDAPKVGLVGAAISDHPKLVDMLQTLVDSGRQVSVSSLRADRVARRPRIAALLRQSGARSLTVALDAASKDLRRTIAKGTTERHLLTCAEHVGNLGFESLKVYMMIGLPGETDADMEELVHFALELSKLCRITLGVSTFVAKRMTPMDGMDFAGIKVVERRLKALQRALRGKVEVRPQSVKWAWVEYVLAQGGPPSGIALMQAVHDGGSFSAYKKAFRSLEEGDRRPWVINAV